MEVERFVRIAYEKDEETGNEYWNLQIMTDDEPTWYTTVRAQFVSPREFPDAENDYIDFSFVIELMRLIDLGFTLCPNIAKIKEEN